MTQREAKTAKEHFHIRDAEGALQPQPYRSAAAAWCECTIGGNRIYGFKVVKVMRGRPCPCTTSSVAKPSAGKALASKHAPGQHVDAPAATDSGGGDDAGQLAAKVNTPNPSNPVRQDGRRGHKAQDTANLRQATPAARTCKPSLRDAEFAHWNMRTGGSLEG